MPRFAYQARDGAGALTSGVMAAESESVAQRLLRQDGKFVVKIKPTSQAADDDAPFTLEQAARHVKRDEVIYFTHQMSIMIQTGVSISEALESVAEQATSEPFRAILNDVAQQVNTGTSLSQALSRHERVFGHLMISLIQASEASGTMGLMLERISAYLTKERQTIRKIRGALMYPIFMLFMAIGVTVFLLIFVLPRFSRIYEGRGASLPTPTRLLIATSDWMINSWYIWVGSIVALTIVGLYLRTIPAGRRFYDHLKLNTPVIGSLFRQLYVTRATQTMGTMISAGVPMLEMIHITRRVTRNVFFQELWDRVDARLQQGSQLSEAIYDSTLIPKSISRMISSGERAGRLGQTMERIASFSEVDFDESVRRSTQFIEPIMIVVMGLIVGSVAISLLLPIFSIGRVMAGG